MQEKQIYVSGRKRLVKFRKIIKTKPTLEFEHGEIKRKAKQNKSEQRVFLEISYGARICLC